MYVEIDTQQGRVVTVVVGGTTTGGVAKQHWFNKVEDLYGRAIRRVLDNSAIAFVAFAVLLVGLFRLGAVRMDFVMFPDEETREVRLTGEAPKESTRYETARAVQPVEDILSEYLDQEVVGFRNYIARTRRGAASRENAFRMLIEILPKEERDKSADELCSPWLQNMI